MSLNNKNRQITTGLFLLGIVSLGLCLRLNYINRSNFVLNDGGMFYTMIIDLQRNNFSLPTFISYNFNQIPFAYPPLSFYLAASLNQFLHVDLVTLLRFLPLLFNIVSIPAFYFLAREIVQNRNQALMATAFYAILLPGYEWLISGGGLTRAPSQLFFILAMYFFIAYTNGKELRHLCFSIICASLMTLHHLEYSLLLLIGMAVFVVKSMDLKTFIRTVLIYVSGTILLTSPYWLTVLTRYGIAPLISAFSTGEFNLVTSIAHLLSMSFTDESIVMYINVLAIIGLFFCLFSGKWRLVIWFLLIIFVSPRSVNRPLIFPVTIFASITVCQIILPEFDRLYKRLEQNQVRNKWHIPHFSHIFIAFSVFYPFFLGLIPATGGSSALISLTRPELAAMEWVKNNTPETSQFVILDQANTWGVDRLNEWFPALAQRKSLTTVQGTEWLPDHRFEIQKANYYELKKCAQTGLSCLETWMAKNSVGFTHIALAKSDCSTGNSNCLVNLETSLRQSEKFQNIFENDRVIVFKKVE